MRQETDPDTRQRMMLRCDSDAESLELLQVVVQRLDVGEHTHGVWFIPHLQHVVHLDQTEAVGLLPATHSRSSLLSTRCLLCVTYDSLGKRNGETMLLAMEQRH